MDNIFGHFKVFTVLNISELNKYLIDIKYHGAQEMSDSILNYIAAEYGCRILPNSDLKYVPRVNLQKCISKTDITNLYVWIYISSYFAAIKHRNTNLLVQVPLHTYLTKLRSSLK